MTRLKLLVLLITAFTLIGLAAGAGAQSIFGLGQDDAPKRRNSAPARGERAALENFQETAEASKDTSQCDPIEKLMDADGDIRRNLDKLTAGDVCPKLEVFHEGSLKWVLQIFQNKNKPDGFFWFVPHDNEQDAFDTAAYSLRKYGGTMIAVETGGTRFNGPQDPNRNFDAGTGIKCREQIAPSPKYTRAIMRWRSPDALILALHTNERGYAGDGQGGAGGISMAKPLPHTLPFRARSPLPVESPDDTMVFVASTERPDRDEPLAQFVDKLNRSGVNVLYEVVSKHSNDCSMSNYAALMGIRNYFNIEVVAGDGAGQRRVLDALIKALPPGGLSPPAALAAADGQQQGRTAAAPDNDAESAGAKPGYNFAAKEKAEPQPGQFPAGPGPLAESKIEAQSGAKGFHVQVASARDDATAERKWEERLRQFSSLLREKTPKITEATNGKEGTRVYRVLIGPFDTKGEAVKLCNRMKDAAREQEIRETVCLVR